MKWLRRSESKRTHLSRRYTPSLSHRLGGVFLEDRALAAPAFFRLSTALFGNYSTEAGALVPDDFGSPTIVWSPPTSGSTPTGAHFGSAQGSFSGISQVASGTVIDSAVIPPYSSSSVSYVEFVVDHLHQESGNSFANAMGPLGVETRATGGDGWLTQDWQDASVTVDFVLDAKIQSLDAYITIDINFQSSYFGFRLVGDCNNGVNSVTLTTTDGTGAVLTTRSFLGSTGIDVGSEHFTVPATSSFGVNYDSFMQTYYYGPSGEPIVAGGSEQSIDWHVGFTLH